jgi:hypothetical protein
MIVSPSPAPLTIETRRDPSSFRKSLNRQPDTPFTVNVELSKITGLAPKLSKSGTEKLSVYVVGTFRDGTNLLDRNTRANELRIAESESSIV